MPGRKRHTADARTLALLPVALLSIAAKGGGCGGGLTGASDGGTGDGGACVLVSRCVAPNIPVGCHLGTPACVNGVAECPPVVCSDDDASSPPPDGASPPPADASSPPDDASTAPADASTPPGDSGACGPVCSDASAGDDSGGGTFTCDSGNGSPIQCEARTQACEVIHGGAYPGIHAPECVTLPGNCASAPTCTCVEAALSTSGTCTENSGNFTVTEDVP